MNYIFTSERLGFRVWTEEDLPEFAALNADQLVMEHFPKPLTWDEAEKFIERLQKHHKRHGHCYYATEIKETREFIGFIGLAYQDYPTEFTPAVDIGWRLKRSTWGNGYATEGAMRCLEYAFNTLKLVRVISTCTVNNIKSENVMRKIGMQKMGTFFHPKLSAYPKQQKCVWYEVRNV